MENENIVKVGVSVMVLKEGKALLGKRKGKHAPGVYAFPGGHFEYMESFEDTAKREVMEETGMEVDNIRFLRLLNLKDFAPKHYVDVCVVCDWKSGEPKVMESEKCEGWDWYEFGKFPEPVFPKMETILEAYKGGRNFYDN